MSSKIDRQYAHLNEINNTKELTCPKCLAVCEEPWRLFYDSGAEAQGDPVTCSSCGSRYRTWRHEVVTYSSRIEEDEDV